jgi:hypothetical protein
MSASQGDDEEPLTRQRAIEILEREIWRNCDYPTQRSRYVKEHFPSRFAQRVASVEPPEPDDVMITLPLKVAQLVLACARDGGVYKGQGRGGVKLSRRARLYQQHIFAWAKGRRSALKAKMGAGDAEKMAVEEALEFARKRYGLKLKGGTILRKIRSRKVKS